MTETDRELLELSAKAAGYVVLASLAGHADGTTHWWKGAAWGLQIEGVEWIWNPIIDDGDAFRLAVKLGISVLKYPACISTKWPQNNLPIKLIGTDPPYEDISDGQDPYAATRRAIVRAAAEIGRNMK